MNTIIQEMLLATSSERQGRAIDKGQSASMEDKKAGRLFLMNTPSSSQTRPAFQTDALIAEDIDAYLHAHQHKSLLRFITCGSVDDGKSTLIGRLLYDSKMIFEDQLDALESDSRRHGTQGRRDRLRPAGRWPSPPSASRASTIDVAYRFFSTNRKAQVHRRRYPPVTNNIPGTW